MEQSLQTDVSLLLHWASVQRVEHVAIMSTPSALRAPLLADNIPYHNIRSAETTTCLSSGGIGRASVSSVHGIG